MRRRCRAHAWRGVRVVNSEGARTYSFNPPFTPLAHRYHPCLNPTRLKRSHVAPFDSQHLLAHRYNTPSSWCSLVTRCVRVARPPLRDSSVLFVILFDLDEVREVHIAACFAQHAPPAVLFVSLRAFCCAHRSSRRESLLLSSPVADIAFRDSIRSRTTRTGAAVAQLVWIVVWGSLSERRYSIGDVATKCMHFMHVQVGIG